MLQREWRAGEGLDCQSKQQDRVVVGGRPVEVDDLARQAAMDEDPLAAAANRDGNRLHQRPALPVPVTRDVVVEVAAPQAVWTVIAMAGAGRVKGDVEPAVPAAECLAGRMVGALMSASIGQRRTSGCVRTRTGRRAPELDASAGGEARHDEVHRHSHRSPPLMDKQRPDTLAGGCSRAVPPRTVKRFVDRGLSSTGWLSSNILGSGTAIPSRPPYRSSSWRLEPDVAVAVGKGPRHHLDG